MMRAIGLIRTVWWQSVSLGLLVAVCGCQPVEDSMNRTAIPVAESGESRESSSTRLDSVNPAVPVVSPADEPSTPDGVVRRYVQLLQQGNLKDAEKHLSKMAAMNFRNAELLLEAPGGNTASYQYSKPKYSTNKQELAYVDCLVAEEVDGESYSSTLTWMVRRDGQVWQIIGMSMTLEEGSGPQLLSFENPDDIVFIQENL